MVATFTCARSSTREGDERLGDNLVFALLECWPMRTWDDFVRERELYRGRSPGPGLPFAPRVRRSVVTATANAALSSML
jgi:hypothetical protein